MGSVGLGLTIDRFFSTPALPNLGGQHPAQPHSNFFPNLSSMARMGRLGLPPHGSSPVVPDLIASMWSLTILFSGVW